ncbi:MAG: hypothetical protein HRT66_00510 [Flavobacteriaceae bacterium]|nr:hypothetical protein [Flavobacteriaceae bacterium]
MFVKYRIINLFTVLILVSSCCIKESVEIEVERYELSEKELELIPYSDSQQISFIHSEGYVFDFNVEGNIVEQGRYYLSDHYSYCNDVEYVSYEYKRVEIKSNYPNLNIEFSVGGDENIYDYQDFLQININGYYYAYLPYDGSINLICNEEEGAICHDSIIINGKKYNSVLEKPFKVFPGTELPVILRPKYILYNKQQGLIQIKMSNDETYSINN